MRKIDRASRISVHGDIARIALPCGGVAVIDAGDVQTALPFVWCKVNTSKSKSYVLGRTTGGLVGRKTIFLHRLIIQAHKGTIVDHKNGDTFDNRKANLRFCDASGNSANSTKHSATTGFKGVKLDRRTGKFIARITKGKRGMYIGSFLRAIDAAFARDWVACSEFGEFAKLNGVAHV